MGLRGILNVEGAFALAWLALLGWRSRSQNNDTLKGGTRWRWLVLLAAVPFLPYLSFPFLADDYVHILHANAFSAGQVKGLFTVPATDQFFRPLVYLSYAMDARWAHGEPALWRAAELAIHLVNSALVYKLCRRLRFGAAAATCGALLFALHGSRPEAVTWVAARFDLLAVLFGLACLIAALNGRTLVASVALIAAALSKESAFAIPLLALLVFWYAGYRRREIARRVLPLIACAAAVFLYRWNLLGGIGGYHDSSNGAATALQFGFPSTLQSLFPRLWGTLLFPINWTTRPGGLLMVLLVIAAASLLWLALGKPSRRAVMLGVAFAYCCALPVHQFLSIGADLEKSRVLYFASVGFAILFAACITTKRMLVPAAFVLIFHTAALQHNLEIWKRVGFGARAACTEGARNLPNVVEGVYFLHTGYPECLNFK